MEQKNEYTKKLEKEKYDLEKDVDGIPESNEIENKLKYNHTLFNDCVPHCFGHFRNKMDNKKGNKYKKLNNNNEWHHLDVELVKVIIYANRYTFRNTHNGKYKFRQDIYI